VGKEPHFEEIRGRAQLFLPNFPKQDVSS